MIASAADTAYWENLPKQQYNVDDHGFGDCWRACIAAILCLKNEDLPLFRADEEGITGDELSAEAQKWLASRGYILFRGISPNGIYYPKYAQEDNYHHVPIIAVGPTVKTKSLTDYRHCCVYELATDRLLYDPTDTDRDPGLISIEEVLFILGV
jgi:hypothetical protein